MSNIKINKKHKHLLESVAMAFATSNLDSQPNTVAVSCARVVEKDKILLTDNFFNKTKKNLSKNTKVSIAIWSKDEKYGYQFRGTAEYITEGKWKTFVDNMEENKGLAHKAAVLITVKEIYKL